MIPHCFTHCRGLHANCLKVRCVSASSVSTPSKSSCGSISGFSNDTTKCGSRAWYHRVSSHTQNAQTELGSSSQVKFEKVPPPIVSNYTGIEWEWISTGHYYIVIILSASSKTKHLQMVQICPNMFSTHLHNEYQGYHGDDSKYHSSGTPFDSIPLTQIYHPSCTLQQG